MIPKENKLHNNKVIRIMDIPWNEKIVTISYVVKSIITLDTLIGRHPIKKPTNLRQLKVGNRLRLVKCIRESEIEKANGDIRNLKPQAYTIFEWNASETYEFWKDNKLISKYIPLNKVLKEWRQSST